MATCDGHVAMSSRLRGSMITTTAVLFAVALASRSNASDVGLQTSLTLEQRVLAQRAIEGVYWKHRIWPESNPRPKPSLDEAMPEGVLRSKVEDYLRQSAALEKFWDHEITGEALQAEMNRMARETQAPEVLRELFAALGNSPLLIAECLARPALADRLIRRWYARDERFHATTRTRAEEALEHVESAGDLRLAGGVYREVEWIRDDGAHPETAPAAEPGRPHKLRLAPDQWEHMVRRLGGVLDIEHDDATSVLGRLPVGRVSPLRETDDEFLASVVLEKETDRLLVASVSWPKRTYGEWWSEVSMEIESLRKAPGAHPYGVPEFSAGDCTYDAWSRLPAAPEPRYSHAAVWTGSEMIVWGGIGTLGYLNTGGRYDPATDTWRPTRLGDRPSGRYLHTAVWTGSEMIVWGGVFQSGQVTTGGRYNPLTDSWMPTTVGSNVPVARYYHTAVWTGGEMIVWGGYSNGVLNTGGRYSPSTDSWTPTSTGSSVPESRFLHSAIWTGSEMIVWGGYNNSVRLNTGGRYNPSTDSWMPTSMGSNAPAARDSHSAVWTGSEMIVWGGAVGGNTGGRYNPSTDSWTPTSAAPNVPLPRNYHTAVWTGSEMIVWGGHDSFTSAFSKTGARYNPATDAWASTRTTSAPNGRQLHTAVWTGHEMIVWGGYNYDYLGVLNILNTGGRYNPAADNWIPTSTDGPPPARELHTTVWTGSEMIVWGGFDGATYHSTGSRYNLALNQWNPTSSVGAPDGRYDHTAVWTGSEMIVWGGDNGGRLSSGGRYNPDLDTWAPVTLVGAPTPRSTHTALWAGAEMVVWGGNGDANVRTGGRYNPLAETWTPTTLSGAPSARSNHTAVWTGNEMIVWGGDLLIGTGGRYRPTTNSWAPTSTIGAPEGRYFHSAVWTGDEMIVWGGAGGANLATGGRYDPASDAWTATSTAGAPAARSHHRGVWTGSQMVLWGGYDGSAYLDTGGRYQPATDTWTSTSVSEAAVGRGRHTDLWTGSEMIIWGGYGPLSVGGLGYLDSGARYCPCSQTDATCNALDDDCNGMIDEGYVPLATTCGVGACESTGTTSCAGGITIDSCAPGTPAPDDSVCNGIDDNCNGQVDEDYVPQPTTCGVGVCAQTGSTSCVGGAITDSCVSGTPAASDSLCNSLDDDCDGLTDEDYVSLPTSCGVGACERIGSTSCGGGVVLDSCTPGAPGANDEICNGVDDDCNGIVDEAYQPLPTTCGVGACAASGSTSCVGGAVVDSCTPGPPAANDATCDGVDDDCDGTLDEDAPFTTYYRDADGDGYGSAGQQLVSCSDPVGYVANSGDCEDADAAIWSTPGEAVSLRLSHDAISAITTLTWGPPGSPGGAPPSLRYDTLRSVSAADFQNDGVCLDSQGTDTTSADGLAPSPRQTLHYVVRARNACPAGVGVLGFRSNGEERIGRDCP